MTIEVIEGFPFVFYGHVFNSYLASDRQWYLPLSDICEALELNISGQRQRIKRDDALVDFLQQLPLETPYGESTRIRKVACLNIKRLPYWLGTIDASRVAEDKRKKVILFKREFAEAAWQVFRTDFMPEDVIAEMDAFETPEQQELNQIFDEAARLRKKIDKLNLKVEESLEELGDQMSDFSGRLGMLEARFVGKSFINTAQQRKIKKMVSTLVLARWEKNKAKSKNIYFAETWNDFNKHFDIPLYALLEEQQLPVAVDYLRSRWSFYLPGRSYPTIFEKVDQSRLF